MNRLHCINCQTTWPSLPYHQLEEPHNCPVCGDQLAPMGTIGHATEDGTSPAPVVHLDQAA